MIRREGQQSARDMLKFIDQSPSCFHVISNIKERLDAVGFIELSERNAWKIEFGKSYYVVRNDSSLISFRLPDKQDELQGFHFIASHSDSPTFKIKENPEITVEKNYVKLNTEKYGGMLHATWFDRPLSIAGRVAVQDTLNNNPYEMKTKLVNIDRDLLVIPNVAIHMNREVNKGIEYNPQMDLLPLFSEKEDENLNVSLREKIAEVLSIPSTEILGQDLFLYVREKGRLIGANEEFVLAPRLDDLQCVYASMEAFLESKPKQYINVLAVFDNEEVGSGTKQGADSTFLDDVMKRMEKGIGTDDNELRRLLAGSFLISADNAHAVHPNHPEKADLTNRPQLNGGVVIKYHGAQKYTTDAVSAAVMKKICMDAGVPFQMYANRSDIPGGSTLGNISTSHVSVSSVDVGLAQLAMHSAMETAGTRDTEYAIQAFKKFYSL